MKILWTDQIPSDLLQIAEELLPEGFGLKSLEKVSVKEALKFVADADFLLASGRLSISDQILQNAARLKFIQKLGAGYDNLDLEAIKKFGIRVAVTRGVNAVSVAEHTILLILAVYRKLVYLDRELRNGAWNKWNMRMQCFDLDKKLVGLIGFGAIGKEVAKRLSAFGAEMLYHQRTRLPESDEKKYNVRFAGLDELFKVSDVISIHVPLTPETDGFINRARLQRMKASAILINTSRGKVVDERALYEALSTGSIAGAGLDVFTEEPPGPGNPLFRLANVVVTPHAGSATADTFRRMMKRAFDNIKRVAEGLDPHAEDILVF